MTQPSSPATAAPLSGVRVIEWSSGRPGAYAGKLLAGLGAEVVLLESDPDVRNRQFHVGVGPTEATRREALVRFLHGGKRSVFCDPLTPEGQDQFLSLLTDADVLVMERPLRNVDAAGLAPESLIERFPRLVVAAITLAGLEKPYRYHRYSDLVAHALGGIAFATPKVVPDVTSCPPLKPGGFQADYSTGLGAANSVLLGIQLRRRTNAGKLFDISAQAMMASYMRQDYTPITFTAIDKMAIFSTSRQSPNGRYSTLWGLVPCRDGYFAFQASEQYQWEGLMRVMGDPEWSREERFQDPLDRVALWDEIEPHFIAWTLEHDKVEIFHAAQREHVPVFPCYTVAELLEDEQQVARSFFVDLPAGNGNQLIKVPGAMVHLQRTPWQPNFEAPAPGADTSAFSPAPAQRVKETAQ